MVNLGMGRVLGLEFAHVARLYVDLPGALVRQVVLGGSGELRTQFWNRWGFVSGELGSGGGPRIWIDVLSGGEVMQIHSFVGHLKRLMPGARVLVSTNNTYSYNVAKAISGVDAALYTPWDLRQAVRRMVGRLRPAVLVCVENVPFPVLVREAQSMGVPTVLCSGFMSKDFERHETLRRTMPLKGYLHLDFVGAKSKEDAEGFERIGVDPCRITLVGNMRFDVDFHRVDEAERAAWKRRLRLLEGRRIIVAGSVRAKEEPVVLEAFARVKRLRGDVVLILAPSFFSPELDIEGNARSLGLSTRRRSRIGELECFDADVLILDTFGELSRIYGIADIIFIGGSINPASRLGYGNNIVEPLIQGRPVLFGPFMNRWREFTEALKLVYTGLEVRNAEEFARHVLVLLDRQDLVVAIEKCAQTIVAEHAEAPLRNAQLVADVVHVQGSYRLAK